MRPALFALTALAAITVPAMAQAKPFSRAAIDAAVAAPTRTPANTVRDQYRHPAETLAFFGLKPGDKIVEIWPFGGWFTEILAPFTNAGGGTLTVASPAGKYDDMIAKKLASDLPTYGKVVRTHFPADATAPGIAPNSVDAVLTFRNIHNWMGKPGTAEAAFAEMFAMLKPGGVL